MDDYIYKWSNTSQEERDLLKKDVSSLDAHMLASMEAEIKGLSDLVTSKIDCLSCANCCKTIPTTFNQEDITRAAKQLSISKKELIKRYLIQDLDETYVTNETPCPFLAEDNSCKIYAVRPAACASFPHTGRSHFYNRRNAHVANINVCPITFHTLSKLMLAIKTKD